MTSGGCAARAECTCQARLTECFLRQSVDLQRPLSRSYTTALACLFGAAAFQESLTGLSGEVATMRFNSRGNMLAVGCRDNSMVQVIAYPSMRELVSWK
jgi:hypothetical protein